MMKTFLTAVAAALLIIGCRPSDDDIRRIVREEMASPLAKSFVKPVTTIGPYTPAVKVGGFLFVSGQIGLDPGSGVLVSESIEAETRQVLTNLGNILRAAGYDSSNVVSATVYLKNINDYARMNQIYGGYFPENQYPARVALEVGNLPKNANIEVSVIAYK